jgi:hypothetical protein
VASLEPDDTFIPALLGEDALGVVVRAHIHIEARINALLDTMVAHPSLLPHLRYEQRVRLACALGLDDGWFKQLKLLGDLRNRFGHNINTELTESMVAELDDALPERDRPGFMRGIQVAFPATDSFDSYRRLPARRRFVYLAVSLDKMLALAIQEFRGDKGDA